MFTVRSRMREILLLAVFYLKKHRIAIFFSLLVGIIAVAPHIYFIAKNKTSYKGIYMLESDAERNYLGRQAAALQYGSAVNPFIKGAQAEPSVPYSKIEGWITYPGKLFGLSVLELNLVYKFLFPGIVFFLFYLLFRAIGIEGELSIVGPILIVLGSELFSVSGIKNLVLWRSVYDQFMVYARPINPQISSVFFLSYILLFISNLNKPNKFKVFALAIILGLSFYVYFYTWTFLLVFNTVWFLYFLCKKRREYYVLLINALGVVTGFFALQQIYSALKHPGYQELANLTVTQATHKPILGLVCVVATILFVYINKRYKLNSLAKSFVIVGLLSVWIVNNQQILTGLNIQAGHYHWYYNLPIFVIIFIIALQSFFSQIEDQKSLKRIVIVLLITASFLSSILIQKSSYEQWESVYEDYQKLAAVVDIVRKQYGPENVVLANEHASEIINLYGGFHIFWSYHSRYYLYKDNRRVYTQEWLKDHVGAIDYSKLPNIDLVIRHKHKDSWIGIENQWKNIAENGDWQAFEVIHQ